VYVVCGDIDGLEAGVYHFNPGDFALRRLRDGDFRGVMAKAAGGDLRIAAAPVTLVFTAISWRSTWKYRDRAYRYHFWDNGMILANALAMGAAHNIPAAVVMGFVESEVNKLIGIDGQQELALSLLALGHTETVLPEVPTIEDLSDIAFDVVPISDSPVDYPLIREAHAASSFTDEEETREWRVEGRHSSLPAIEGEPFALVPVRAEGLTDEPVEDVVQRRASTRRFAPKPLPFADLSAILERATQGIPADFLAGDEMQLNDIYAIVNRVEGLPAGAYFYRRKERALELLKPGDFSKKAAYLTLGQDLGGDASVTFFFMADLKEVLEACGNRGYRAVQMEAGIIGGKMYLTAYALRRGATGLTFYDDDVTEFFSPHATGKSCILVVSAGIPGKRPLV
jgi:SagB-type dehydrogenase family enzyme